MTSTLEQVQVGLHEALTTGRSEVHYAADNGPGQPARPRRRPRGPGRTGRCPPADPRPRRGHRSGRARTTPSAPAARPAAVRPGRPRPSAVPREPASVPPLVSSWCLVAPAGPAAAVAPAWKAIISRDRPAPAVLRFPLRYRPAHPARHHRRRHPAPPGPRSVAGSRDSRIRWESSLTMDLAQCTPRAPTTAYSSVPACPMSW